MMLVAVNKREFFMGLISDQFAILAIKRAAHHVYRSAFDSNPAIRTRAMRLDD
jgi:hypothetical protein